MKILPGSQPPFFCGFAHPIQQGSEWNQVAVQLICLRAHLMS
jgi:hypothetical protein